jgi:hypothetical protein
MALNQATKEDIRWQELSVITSTARSGHKLSLSKDHLLPYSGIHESVSQSFVCSTANLICVYEVHYREG